MGLEWYQKSLALPGSKADPVERARTLNNIGINLKDLGRLDESLETLHRALEAFRVAGEAPGQAAALNNLGATLERMDRLDEAEATLREALARSTGTGYGEGVVNASLGLGRVCDRTGRSDEARMHLVTALDVAQHAGLRGCEVEAHDALADLCERCGASAEALHHLRASREIERLLLSEASDRRLKMLSIRYQVTAAQREADLMRAKQDELARANARLAALNLDLAASDAQKSRLVVELERQSARTASPASPTGAPDQRLRDEFDRAVRYGRPLAVAIADLDHCAGYPRRRRRRAEACRERAHRRGATGPIWSRVTGGASCWCWSRPVRKPRPPCARRCGQRFAAHDWDIGLAITVSIGWSTDTTLAGPDAMLGVADAALYRAKAAGRNRIAGRKNVRLIVRGQSCNLMLLEITALTPNYILRTSPTITPNTSSAPSGRIGA